jgi:probable rRNA maturation factor
MPGTRGRIPAAELRRIARHVLNTEGAAPDVEVEVVLADAATSRDLNRLYRGRDEPTDVLSFAALEGGPFVESPDADPSLGEVVICVPVAESQHASGVAGGEDSRTIDGELAHLLVHGLLHLLGYDHEAGEAEAQLMQGREESLLEALGYADRYAHGH